jgi:hypothetical protein
MELRVNKHGFDPIPVAACVWYRGGARNLLGYMATEKVRKVEASTDTTRQHCMEAPEEVSRAAQAKKASSMFCCD